MTCITSQRSFGYQRLHVMRNPYGDVLFSSQQTRISRTYFLSLKACVGCLFSCKGPQHAAVPQSSSGMRFVPFKLRPHGVWDANSVFAVNFTSLGFVGLVYNTRKCEINPVFTSLVLCTRRKLGLGLTIYGIIKTVFVPP